jgi:hypothetical protein
VREDFIDPGLAKPSEPVERFQGNIRVSTRERFPEDGYIMRSGWFRKPPDGCHAVFPAGVGTCVSSREFPVFSGGGRYGFGLLSSPEPERHATG